MNLRQRKWIATLLASLSVVLLVHLHQREFTFATPVSRLDLLHAVVGLKCLSIDQWHTNTCDKAIRTGRYYSDKAPGTVALALPGFWLATQCVEDPESPAGWLATSWAATAISQALPAAVGAGLLWLWLVGIVTLRAALVTTLGLFLGGMPIPYASALWSHAQVIGLISISIWAVGLCGGTDCQNRAAEIRASCFARDALAEDADTVGGGRVILAGFCVGLAVASEYTTGIVALALTGHVALRQPRALWRFGLGALPPLLLIPAYSWATLGTPFALPYSYQASFPEMREGLYAIKWPDLENLGRLLIGPTRGLIFWTPFLVMAGFGWWWMARERPRWLWLTYAVPVLHAVVISGRTWDWQAGFTISARYMAPILPLLALPCAIGTQRWPRLGATLAGVSILMMTLATLTDACPDYSIYNPLIELHIPKLLRGEFSYTLGTEVFGLNPWVSVGLYYAILIGGIAWLWRLAGQADRQEGANAAECP